MNHRYKQNNIENEYNKSNAKTNMYIIHKYVGVDGLVNIHHTEYIIKTRTNRNPNNIIKDPSIIYNVKNYILMHIVYSFLHCIQLYQYMDCSNIHGSMR